MEDGKGMQRTIKQVKQSGGAEAFSLSQRIKEISEKVKIIRFGIVYETKENPWDRLASAARRKGLALSNQGRGPCFRSYAVEGQIVG
jgi:hypothetical protein